ncbi:MAG TPA: glycosyltransferase family 2 protein [Verrucomicrobiae bacterium]|nr:glycosyltransferase family 2 protein [Verrucomicrobiae bacterium]
MTISAIVPVWNGKELLARLLRSLGTQTLQPIELIAVDNGSTDGAPEVARQAGARVIPMGRNAGFAAAANRGIGEASGDALAILNSDVELGPQYLALLAADLENSGAWFATGKLLRDAPPAALEPLIDGTFDVVCRGGTAARLGFGQPAGAFADTGCSIWSAPWTAALFRAGLFAKAGLLDERFESYLEDVDFGLRCARLGLGGVYVPQAVAHHRGSASLGRWHAKTVRLTARNQVFLLARHYSPGALRRHAWRIAVAHLLWGGLALRHGAPLAWLRGKLQGIRQWRALRGEETFDRGELDRLLTGNEALIRQSMREAGSADLYWKLYFLLSGSGAK